jgi:prepilin-type processing-associated H-X9-DG protein
VIAIIGILVALLLPAVQAAREAARRSSCVNNLVQLILAVNQYEMAHSVYPPGTIDSKGPIASIPVGYHHSWITQILPYVEQRNAYLHIDRSVGVYHKNNGPVRDLGIDTLRCSSSPNSQPGYSNYAGCHHDVEAPIDVTNNGVFFLNSRIGYDDLLDGSSQTIFLGEKLTLAGDLGWMSGTNATLRNTGTAIAAGRGMAWPVGPPGKAPVPFFLPGKSTVPFAVPITPAPTSVKPSDSDSAPQADPTAQPATSPADESGKGSAKSEPGETGNETGTTAPDTTPTVGATTPAEQPAPSEPAAPANGPAGTQLIVGGFGSFHPGGANFAMGDGSVRYLTSAINPTVYQQLGHRADGKLLSSDSY